MVDLEDVGIHDRTDGGLHHAFEHRVVENGIARVFNGFDDVLQSFFDLKGKDQMGLVIHFKVDAMADPGVQKPARDVKRLDRRRVVLGGLGIIGPGSKQPDPRRGLDLRLKTTVAECGIALEPDFPNLHSRAFRDPKQYTLLITKDRLIKLDRHVGVSGLTILLFDLLLALTRKKNADWRSHFEIDFSKQVPGLEGLVADEINGRHKRAFIDDKNKDEIAGLLAGFGIGCPLKLPRRGELAAGFGNRLAIPYRTGLDPRHTLKIDRVHRGQPPKLDALDDSAISLNRGGWPLGSGLNLTAPHHRPKSQESDQGKVHCAPRVQRCGSAGD